MRGFIEEHCTVIGNGNNYRAWQQEVSLRIFTGPFVVAVVEVIPLIAVELRA